MIPNQFVILWNNQPIGLDSNSGGYPFKTENPNLIYYWSTRKAAQEYADIMTMKGKSITYSYFDVREIQFRIVSEG